MVDGAKIILLIRQIIEGILLVWGIYILSGRKLDNKVIYAGAAYGMLVKVIRLLPISFGVHTILLLLLTILMVDRITNISILNNITSTLTVFLVMIFSDWIALIIYTNILNIKMEKLLNGSIESSLYGIGPLTIMVMIFFALKYIRKNKKI